MGLERLSESYADDDGNHGASLRLHQAGVFKAGLVANSDERSSARIVSLFDLRWCDVRRSQHVADAATPVHAAEWRDR